MKLEGTMLIVKDMDVSRRFYQDLLSGKVMLDLGDYVVFEGGYCLMAEGQWTEFLEKPATSCTYGNNVCELSFGDDDIDAFMRHLAAFPDVEILNPLKEYPWGQRAVRFYDPDRHIIEVGEDMKVVVKRFLRFGLSIEETMQRSMFPRAFVEMCNAELQS